MPTIHDLPSLEAFAALGRALDVWVKVDCGVGRLGFLPKDFAEAFRRLKGAPALHLAASTGHFRNPHDREQLDSQAGLFLDACQAAEAAGFSGFARMVASSRIVLSRPDLQLTAVNPGKALYGYVDQQWPFADRIKQVACAVKARVIQVKEYQAGVVLLATIVRWRRRAAPRSFRSGMSTASTMHRPAARFLYAAAVPPF